MSKLFYNPPFVLTVTASGVLLDKQFDFDSRVTKIISLQVLADFQDKAWFRGSQSLEINGDTIIPEGVDTKLLISNSGVDPNPRFMELGDIAPGNLKCRIKYQDTDHPAAPFAAYFVKYLFKCEI